jgi:hypothetical protein
MGGNIGLTEKQLSDMEELKNEKKTGVNINNNKIKWTDAKEEKLSAFIKTHEEQELPKGMQTELRKIFRAESEDRNFVMTTKYLVKGLQQEEESITLYQQYRNSNGIRTYFKKNDVRLYNEYLSGEPDINPLIAEIEGVNKKIGFDTKTAWELKTMPFPDDALSKPNDWQNHGYIFLTGADEWWTVNALVNATEDAVFKEKQKHYFALKTKDRMPDEEGSKYYDEYIRLCRDIEKMMIFDYDRFVDQNAHIMEIQKEEWHRNQWDIIMSRRIVERATYYSAKKQQEIIDRVLIGRKYFKQLQSQIDSQKLLV